MIPWLGAPIEASSTGGATQPGFQKMDVEIDNRKARLRRERPRERALARPGHAGDHHAASDGHRRGVLTHTARASVKPLSDTNA